jgi:hypothetical protein
MRSTPRLITAEEMRSYSGRVDIAVVEGEEVYVVAEDDDLTFDEIVARRRGRTLDCFLCVDALGTEPPDGRHQIPEEILIEAEMNNSRVGIDMLALSKPYGDIFDPEHWLYDSIRDNFTSVIKCYDYNDFREYT